MSREAELEAALRALVDGDPLVDLDGFELCVGCGGPVGYRVEEASLELVRPWREVVQHDAGCAWLAAAELLGLVVDGSPHERRPLRP